MQNKIIEFREGLDQEDIMEGVCSSLPRVVSKDFLFLASLKCFSLVYLCFLTPKKSLVYQVKYVFRSFQKTELYSIFLKGYAKGKLNVVPHSRPSNFLCSQNSKRKFKVVSGRRVLRPKHTNHKARRCLTAIRRGWYLTKNILQFSS